VNVTLPIPIKSSMLELQKRSGMKKAEFLRTALMMGTAQLAEQVKQKEPIQGFSKVE
jgi:hypothetical protein